MTGDLRRSRLLGSIIAVTLIVMMVPIGVWFWNTWQASRPPETTIGTRPEPTATPAPTTEEVTTTVEAPVEVPECTVGEAPVDGNPVEDWATVVVDTERRLPADFQPPDLVDVHEAGFESNGERVRQLMVDDLTAMRDAAEANGTPFIIVSAHRTPEQQRVLFDAGTQEHGPEGVVTRIARPGHSEHQLGTAIDVLNPEARELGVSFAATPVGQWLAEHAHQFGFVFSYPQGGVAQACYEYEPWHLRYVGPERAAQIRESEMTPREWMLTGQEAENDGDGQGADGAAGNEPQPAGRGEAEETAEHGEAGTPAGPGDASQSANADGEPAE